jgi:carboxypeptidase Q
MKNFIILTITIIVSFQLLAQKEDSLMLRKIYDEVLVQGECYENLRSLCKDVGNRISGSKNAEKAVIWGEKLLQSYQFDTVFKQEVMVPRWVRGEKEKCTLVNGTNNIPLNTIALGGSISTNGIISANIIEVKSFDELEALNSEEVKGKIVFYNVPMEPKHIRTFNAYGGCYPYRSKGPSEAAKKGATATILRSLSLKLDNAPHTGTMSYEEGVNKIPCCAIGTLDAELLSKQLITNNNIKIELEMNCKTLDDVLSYNVIGQINGKTNPDKYIIVGGHLDSWDIGEGAHDDGAGIVHSIEVLRTLKKINYTPNNSLRVILYMNEENGNRGGEKYAELAKNNSEYHIAALESDRGGFVPRGFSMDGTPSQLEKLKSWKPLFIPYDIHYFVKGYGGVDISPLKNGQTSLIGLVPDSQRYFDFHHAPTDVFENVHKRELEMGAATMTSLIYLIDKYGFE